jgi:hypothetical protein
MVNCWGLRGMLTAEGTENTEEEKRVLKILECFDDHHVNVKLMLA